MCMQVSVDYMDNYKEPKMNTIGVRINVIPFCTQKRILPFSDPASPSPYSVSHSSCVVSLDSSCVVLQSSGGLDLTDPLCQPIKIFLLTNEAVVSLSQYTSQQHLGYKEFQVRPNNFTSGGISCFIYAAFCSCLVLAVLTCVQYLQVLIAFHPLTTAKPLLQHLSLRASCYCKAVQQIPFH